MDDFDSNQSPRQDIPDLQIIRSQILESVLRPPIVSVQQSQRQKDINYGVIEQNCDLVNQTESDQSQKRQNEGQHLRYDRKMNIEIPKIKKDSQINLIGEITPKNSSQSKIIIQETQSKKNSEIIRPLNIHSKRQSQLVQLDRSNIETEEDSSINMVKKSRRRVKIYSFFYDQNASNEGSICLNNGNKNLMKIILRESIFPIFTSLLIAFFITVLQKKINQYCYIDNVCNCSNFYTKLWSYFKQLILFKLAQIIYRAEIIKKLVNQSSLQTRKQYPLMEIFILYILTIGIDFFFVIWIQNNQDWIFSIVVFTIGLVVFINTFKIKKWIQTISNGIGYFTYDLVFLFLFIYAYWIIPNLLQKLHLRYNQYGYETFILIYPLIDTTAESIIDYLLQYSQYADLFVYQAQLILIGVRVGVLMLSNCAHFEFWFCLILLSFFRINNSSMFVTVFLRRLIYYSSPEFLKPITSMEQNSLTLRGKHGAYYEHIIWPLIVYYILYTDTTLAYYIKDYTIITNCQFQIDTTTFISQNYYWYQPLIIWVAFLISEYLGYSLNKLQGYDNIKWLGGSGFNLAQNILIRCLGIYVFSFGFLVLYIYFFCNRIFYLQKVTFAFQKNFKYKLIKNNLKSIYSFLFFQKKNIIDFLKIILNCMIFIYIYIYYQNDINL